MSLNTADAPQGGVVIFNGECILLYCDGVEITFEGRDAKDFQGSRKGRLYLTTHRMIFRNNNTKDRLQSFSFPFYTITNVELEQPVFGANYIKGKVKAQVGGNWTGEAIFKLKFASGGAIEFGQAMLQAAKLASRYMPPQPPPYTPAPGPYYPAPPPAYTPPTTAYYGFVPPTHVFPNAPPANSVYMTDMPPPYPGINAGPQAGAPSAADAKAMEAAQSAYYDPNNQGYAYVPTAPPYEQGPPPPYYEASKKTQ